MYLKSLGGVAGTNVLSHLFDLVFGPTGDLFVSDSSHRIWRYMGPNWDNMMIFVQIGSGGLSSPTGLTFGPDGNLYVANAGTNGVLRYNGTNGNFIDVFVFPDSGGLDRPGSLTFGPDGNLYVCSSGNQSVLRYNGMNGTFIDAFIPTGSGGMSTGPNFLSFTPLIPSLNILHSSADVVLSWSTRATNYVLESESALSGSDGWVVVTNSPAVVGSSFAITNSTGGDASFYRLRKR
jgi:streptogramin lyase